MCEINIYLFCKALNSASVSASVAQNTFGGQLLESPMWIWGILGEKMRQREIGRGTDGQRGKVGEGRAGAWPPFKIYQCRHVNRLFEKLVYVGLFIACQ